VAWSLLKNLWRCLVHTAICSVKITSAENQEQLDELYHELQIEKDVYHQRAKHLQTLFDQRAELVKAQKVSLDDLIDEVKTIEAETTDDLDF
jgi:predicted  nucleic acid-binding Zn-ribbon protein